MELETARLILRKFTEADYDDLYEFLSQLRDNECSWRLLEKAGLVREAHFRKNVFFHRDEYGQPKWNDTV